MKAYYTITIKDKKGKVLRHFRRRSHSFVQQYNELVAVQMGEKTNLSIKDIDGTDRNVDKNLMTLYAKGVVGQSTKGIVYGRGNAAVAIDDYALETLCSQGTGANQLSYLLTAISIPAVSAPDCSFTITRIANNSSGNIITIKEIGLYVAGHDGASSRYFLAIRDVLTSSIVIPDGGAITVVYTIKVIV